MSVCTHMLLDAAGPGHGILLPVPELWGGATFRDLHFYFPGLGLFHILFIAIRADVKRASPSAARSAGGQPPCKPCRQTSTPAY